MFPFEDYIVENSHGDPYQTVFSIANKYLADNSNVLDFGSGPCDKTAIVSLLGHNCIAYDDMQDQWHMESDNSRKILEFATKVGIELINPNEKSIDSQKTAFDMIILNDIIEDAWEIGWFKSNITFKSIFNKWDLTEEDLNIIMSKYLDSKSYKLWVKKIESRKR